MSLTARTLEDGGIATVVIGSALDIAEHCGTPRFLFNDLPLGNPLGKPGDREMQEKSILLALDMIVSARAPGAVVHSDFRFSDDDSWKENYARIDESNRAELLRLGDLNRKRRADNQAKGLSRKQ